MNNNNNNNSNKISSSRSLALIVFCLVQLFFITQNNSFRERLLSSLQTTTITTTAPAVRQRRRRFNEMGGSGGGGGRHLALLDDGTTHHSSNNTNWKNVQYYSGELQDLSDDERKVVLEACNKLAGIQYYDDDYMKGIPPTCFGPLATNTTCCYCFTSYDYEEIVTVQTYKHYKCAVPRNHSLLPLEDNTVGPFHNKKTTSNATINGTQVVFVTGKFGYNNSFHAEINDLCREVRKMNIMDPANIHCYSESPEYALSKREFKRHFRYRQDPNDASARGGGYWLHKSVMLQHHLNQYQDGDLIFYVDADRIDFFRLGSFHAIIESMMMDERLDDDMCIDIIGNTDEAEYTKEDMFAAFNASRTLRASPQFIANFLLVRNSPKSRQLIDAWVECMSDWHMVSDEPSVLPNVPYFFENRHDQSVLGLLVKSFMTSQAVLGPPARPYHWLGEYITYKFNDGADPMCPFSTYYFDQYKKNALLLRNANITTL